MSNDITASTQNLTDALVNNGGAWNDEIRDQQNAAIAGSDQFKMLVAGGVDYNDLMDLVTGKTKDATKVHQELGKALDDGRIDFVKNGTELIHWVDGIQGSGAAAEDAAKKLLAYNAAQKAGAQVGASAAAAYWTGADNYNKYGDAVAHAADETERFSRAAAAGVTVSVDASGAETFSTKWSQAFDDFKSAASEADGQAQLFLFTMQQLSGRNVSDEQAIRASAAAVRALGASYRDQAAAIQAVKDKQADLAKLKSDGPAEGQSAAQYDAAVAAAQRDLAAAIAGTADANDGWPSRWTRLSRWRRPGFSRSRRRRTRLAAIRRR